MAIQSYIFGGDTGISYEELQRRRKALQAQKGSSRVPTTIGGGIYALGEGLAQHLEKKRLNQADEARQGHSDNAFSAFQTILGGGTPSDVPPMNGGQSTGVDVGAADTGETSDFGAPIDQSAMDFASTMLGKGERPDNAVLQDFMKTGGQNLDPATTAWCAAYVNASLKHSGQEGTGKLNARSFLDWGEEVNDPQKGDIAVFSRGDPNGWQGHVGFFDGQNEDKSIRVLGGNQGDGVSIANHPSSRLLGYRRANAQQQPMQVASLDQNAEAQVAFAPQSEPQQPAQGALQTLIAQRNGGGQPQQQPVQVAQAQPQQIGDGQHINPFKGVDPKILELLSDPAISPGRRAIMQLMFKRYMDANAPVDPMKQLQMEKGQLELDQMRNPRVDPMDGLKQEKMQSELESMRNPERKIIQGADKYQYYQDTGERVLPNVQQQSDQYQMVTGEDAQNLGLDPTKAYNIGPDGKVGQIGGGGVNVTVGGDSNFKVPTGFMRDPNNPAQVVPIPGGPQDLNTPTGPNATQMQRVNSAASALQEGLTAYQGLIKTYGTEIMPGEGKDALLAARRDLQLQMKELFNLGVLNGPDLDLMNELLIDPTDLSTAAQNGMSGLFGVDIQSRASANIQQLREQFERLRKSQTPEGFGQQNNDDDPLGIFQ